MRMNLSFSSGGTEVRVRKGSVSYGLGADLSLPHCLVGDRVSEAARYHLQQQA